MPAVVPARVARTSIAMVTAARHLDEPGGRERLLELVDQIPTTDLCVVAVCLSRILGLRCTDEELQQTALSVSGDKPVLM